MNIEFIQIKIRPIILLESRTIVCNFKDGAQISQIELEQGPLCTSTHQREGFLVSLRCLKVRSKSRLALLLYL